MRLYITFLILNFQLSHIFAFPPNPLELLSEAIHNLRGYECGNYFFTDVEVKEALSLARSSIDKGYRYPQRYLGELYSESKFEDYFLFPIRNGPHFLPHMKRLRTVFYIVFTRNSNEVVDVIAKITTGDYTKCIRRHDLHIGPSHSVTEIPNGYLCGHEFITDKTIHKSLALAQNGEDENTKYSSPYIGRLYPENSGYLMWLITKEEKLYTPGTANTGTCFLILNNEGQFVDVVVRGYSNNFLRCLRSREPPKELASYPFSKVFVPFPKSGYLCNKYFFDDILLKENAEKAKNEAGNTNRGSLPIEYSGPPFNKQCLIWPLLRDGRLFKIGHKGKFRLILTPEYKVMSVAMFVKGKYKACERNTVVSKKNHDTSDYLCNEQQFSHQQLVIAAEEACVKMKTVTRNTYPARYKGPRFKLDGPYLTYPVFGNGVVKEFKYNAGFHRVVINMNCEVVGALTTLKVVSNGDLNNRIRKKLVKCHRLDDGPLPSRFFGANAMTVFEHKVRQ